MSKSTSRRQFVQELAYVSALPYLPALSPTVSRRSVKKLNVLCLGGHPDDPESGCGGTLARFAAEGSSVTILYLTRGEAGIPGKSHQESADIRSREAIEACRILKAEPQFAGQTDGDTVMDNTWLSKVQSMIHATNPDLVFTHWPLDSHKDHQVASLMAIQTWIRAPKKFELYFFEVCTGEQTLIFRPTDYVDISEVQEQKRKAVFCHQSQDPPGIYNCGHASMEDFRGREIGVKAAEGFVRMRGMGMANDLGL